MRETKLEFEKKKEILELEHKLKMERLVFERESERQHHEHEMERQRIKTAEIRKSQMRREQGDSFKY